MAIKQKVEQPKSKLAELLTKDYRWENLLLAVVSIAAAVLSLMIITDLGPLTISPTFPLLGEGNWGKVFAWVLLVISLFGLFLVLYPFIMPAIPELKKITWASFGKFFEAVIRTIFFIVIVTGVIIVFDAIIKLIILKGK